MKQLSEESRLKRNAYMREWKARNIERVRANQREAQRRWRERNPGYQKAWIAENPNYQKEWRKENRTGTFEKKIKELVQNARNRAKRNGIEFTITYKDFMAITHCPLLGILLDFATEGKGGKDNSPSIDRIDPSKGYVPGNVWVISYRANRIKSDSTIEELEMILSNLRKMTNTQA